MSTKSSHTPFKGRTAGRMAAAQALFQIEQTGALPSAVVLEFLEYRLKNKKRKIDSTFFARLVEGAWEARSHNDEIIAGALKEGWQLNRLESVTRAILRAALYEMRETQTPSAVVINEYLNLTRSFFDDAEVSFVNGVLNTLAGKIRA